MKWKKDREKTKQQPWNDHVYVLEISYSFYYFFFRHTSKCMPVQFSFVCKQRFWDQGEERREQQVGNITNFVTAGTCVCVCVRFICVCEWGIMIDSNKEGECTLCSVDCIVYVVCFVLERTLSLVVLSMLESIVTYSQAKIKKVHRVRSKLTTHPPHTHHSHIHTLNTPNTHLHTQHSLILAYRRHIFALLKHIHSNSKVSRILQ